MTLHDQLQALADAGKLTAADIKSINDAVTSIKAKATDQATSDIEGIQSQLAEAKMQLGVYTKAEKENKLKSLVKESVSEGIQDKVLKYVNVSDDDDEATIIAKINSVAEDFAVAVKPTTPLEVKKTIGELPTSTTNETEKEVDPRFAGLL